MSEMCRSLALFCGSSDGKDPKFCQLAEDFGRLCAQRGLTLYYGGAKLGLMRAAAEAALEEKGHVIGVMPEIFVDDVVVANNISQMIWVKSMSERKQTLERLADAFVALPGSFGTMDELFEILTDAQLGLHHKPVVILNAFGYYDPLLKQLEIFLNKGFLRPFHHGLLLVAASPEEVFEKLEKYVYPNDQEWLDKHTRSGKN